MGRAITVDKRLGTVENRQDAHEVRIKLMEDALAELVQTRVHHVDLHEEMNKHEEIIRKENNVVAPDEVFTPPAGKRKKTTRKAKSTATT